MNYKEKLSCIRDNLSDVDMTLQLAEEASELSQAASKALRVKLGHNPTPVTEDQALKNVLEEYADVRLSFEALFNSQYDKDVDDVKSSKLDRWYQRVCGQPVNDTVKVDDVPCRKGDVYTGLSDGKKWILLEIVPYNYPHVLKVRSESNPDVVKEVKPEWMCRGVACVDKNGHRIKPGHYVYKGSIILYKVVSVKGDNIVEVTWKLVPNVTFMFNTKTLSHVFTDSVESIVNDMQSFEEDASRYALAANIDTKHTNVNVACMRHFTFRCANLKNFEK